MKTVGIRELKANATQIVRSVRDDAEEYLVTVSGEPVALLTPVSNARLEAHRLEDLEAELAEIDAIARMDSDRPQRMTAAEAVAEQRR